MINELKEKLVELQQPLPFTVLKHSYWIAVITFHTIVATALTVYGIETCI